MQQLASSLRVGSGVKLVGQETLQTQMGKLETFFKEKWQRVLHLEPPSPNFCVTFFLNSYKRNK